ncbi:MAG: hypothetical protein M1833_000052 [Piccolia ochrophora]|nr:MAG: hypothetical protein M1833_000052 [Piccolia ochrophora]
MAVKLSSRPLPLHHLPHHLHHHHQPSRAYSAPPLHHIPASKQKYVPKSGTYPLGFLVSGTHVGVKPSTPKSTPDLALIASETPCSAAAVFTQNKFQAAPVTVSREVLRRRRGSGVRGIVINSGCANAVTGKGGLEDAESMAGEVDRCFEREGNEKTKGKDDGEGSRTLVMSTGVIGQRLPTPKILSAIPAAHSALSTTHNAWLSAASAICTTDTFPKLLSLPFTLPSRPQTTYHLAGMTKGAGMIHPNMATLLGILCTDAPVAPPALAALLTHAVARSFNSISVDGDTSTNDTVALLANGAAGGGPPITLPPSSSSPSSSAAETENDADYTALLAQLTHFSASLAQLIIRDGEGATKFVTIRVSQAATHGVAHAIASTIARSPLVKTALYGKDANWGRILCAVGYARGVPDGAVVPARTSVSFVVGGGEGEGDEREELKLLVRGEPAGVDEERAKAILEREDLEIWVRLRDGEGDGDEDEGRHTEEAVYWTCDFSHEYVTINGDYRT